MHSRYCVLEVLDCCTWMLDCFYGTDTDLSFSVVQFDERYATLFCVFNRFQ